MSDNARLFKETAGEKTFDREHRKIIQHSIGKYEEAVKHNSSRFSNYELARKRAAYIKTQALENLDQYLIEFENNFTRNGGKVIWATDAKEAREEILNILQKKKAKAVVKAKSMTTEEIELNEFLERQGIQTIETDLGEYILQLCGQKPSHFVTPAMHLSRKEIGTLFKEKLKVSYTDEPQELTRIARKVLREKFQKADVGISGANFLIADTGAIAITENEGNARLSTSFPKTHIVIAGIEKIITRMEDLGLFWPLLAHSGTGQTITAYNTVFTGPKKEGETDGPEEMYVILLDNGRTTLLADIEKRQALNCIRCGACLNICPVYQTIGGHSYGTVYSGPIGSVITPHYQGMKAFRHLSHASTLCGACTTVCPVKIDIHELLLLNRRQSVKEQLGSGKEKMVIRLWKRFVKNRKWLNFGAASLKSFVFRLAFKETWGKRRKTPDFAPRSFNQLWKDKKV